MRSGRSPNVSVLMPVRNEAMAIWRSLGAVLAQDYPPEHMEVLVIDGRSDDNTRNLVLEMADRSAVMGGPPVRVLDNPRRIQGAALNIGIEQAKGDVIVRVDGHCVLDPDYVRRCVECLQATGADNVGGLQLPRGLTPVGRAIGIATTSRFGIGNARFHYAKRAEWVDTVYLGAFKREVFERVGRFAEDVGPNEDDDFNLRLAKSGGRIRLDPSIRSVYFCRSSFRAAARQYFRYGFYKVRVIRKRGVLPSVRSVVPPAFVVALAGVCVAAAVTRRPALILIVLGPYIVAMLAAIAVSDRRDPATLPLLPVAFFVLHVAYGVGVLCGMVDWVRSIVGRRRTPSS